MKMMKFLVLFVAGCFGAMAQDYDLGEVTVAELEEKQHPKDPSAPAAILFSKGQSYMTYNNNTGLGLVTEVEMKIKIYTKEGYEWANKVIPYYSSDSSKETVDISKAVTYNLVGGKVQKTKLKSDGEFTEQSSKYWKKKKIMMPDVKEGSIVEYKYTIRSPHVEVLPEWRFQESIPVNHSQYTTKLPEYFIFTPRYRGYFIPVVKQNGATRSFSAGSNHQETDTQYVLDNLPAMKEESYTNNVDNYIASIEHEISLIRLPNQPMKTLSTNWEDVAKTIYKYDSFGDELKRTGYFEEDLTALISGLTSPEEKMATIYSYVKNHMNWNEYTGYTCDEGVKRAYKNKVGNVAEINLMLTGMLRYAGLNAHPVLVSTRSNKIALYPSTSAFNYVIAAVEVNGKYVLLDATSKSAMPNILPIRAINGTGRLIKDDGSSLEIDLMPTGVSKELVTIQAQIDADGKVTGKARDQYFDYNAFAYRERYLGVSQETYLENLEGRHKGLEVSDYKLTNDKELSKPVVEDYSFTHSALADIIGDKIYLNPMLFVTQTENPFKQEKREYPVDFIFPHQDKYMINIAIPQGYVVESIPQGAAVAMEENIGTFRYSIGSNNGQIQLGVTLDINVPMVPAVYYATLKDFYQKVVEKQGEKIVLKKG